MDFKISFNLKQQLLIYILIMLMLNCKQDVKKNVSENNIVYNLQQLDSTFISFNFLNYPDKINYLDVLNKVNMTDADFIYNVYKFSDTTILNDSIISVYYEKYSRPFYIYEHNLYGVLLIIRHDFPNYRITLSKHPLVSDIKLKNIISKYYEKYNNMIEARAVVPLCFAGFAILRH